MKHGPLALIDKAMPVVAITPLQLLAYHIASIRGPDVDQLRNLGEAGWGRNHEVVRDLSAVRGKVSKLAR